MTSTSIVYVFNMERLEIRLLTFSMANSKLYAISLSSPRDFEYREIKTAQEAVKIAEAEALMNRAVSIERPPAFNDSKLYNQYQGRNAGGYRQMSWSRPLYGLPSHLRFLRISSPSRLIIELDDDEDEDEDED
ncbi:hypothetical protein FRC00_007379, partial [Tulasnella sp. 408]